MTERSLTGAAAYVWFTAAIDDPSFVRQFALRAGLSIARRASGRVWSSLEPVQGWDPEPRYGWGRPAHPRLERLLGDRAGEYLWVVEAIHRHAEGLAAIARGSADPHDPSWSYGDFQGLDVASLYCLIRDNRPRRYIEIGSGNSTRVAARAARDVGYTLGITSIDPEPRLPVDALCDRAVRRRLEDADLGLFADLEPGDVLFLDGSHRVLPGNDVTTFFLDIVPELPAGVLLGVHDVYIPDDYPEIYGREYFSEQYLLAAHLLHPGR